MDTSIESLRQGAAYPGDADAAEGIDWIQTHISHVFLSRTRVYKFRKAVDLGFVRFETLAERNADCLREVSLNRRLAPDVYLGVAPLLGGAVPYVGEVAETLVSPDFEHCVVMRRLPEGRDALTLLGEGRIDHSHVERLAQRLVRFHDSASLETPAPFSPEAWQEACTRPFSDCLAALDRDLRDAAPRRTLALLSERFAVAQAALAPRFEERRQAGLAVEGHGDLHLEHVWFERDDAEPVIVDCLEFSSGLRRIDSASDVAFLAMDFAYRGSPRLGEHLLRRFARERSDENLYAVVDFFASYRAAVRAKVAALAALDTSIDAAQRDAARGSAERHLTLAAALLDPPVAHNLVLVGGVVGTGKSSVAEALADELEMDAGAVVISSDRLRKHVHRTDASEPGVDRGRYSLAARAAIYDELLVRARTVMSTGRFVILDATWSCSSDRARAHALARDFGVSCKFVETCCDEDITLDRLTRRAARGDSLSDAGPDLYPESLRRFEPCEFDEHRDWWRLTTGHSAWRQQLAGLSKWIRR